MKALYVKLMLWLIRPALKEHERQLRMSPRLQVVVNPPRFSSEELQAKVMEAVRRRVKSGELHL